MKVFDRLREDHLLGVRFAVNVFIASIIVWITLQFFTHASPIWAIASMIASSEPVVKQGLKMFRSRLINTLVFDDRVERAGGETRAQDVPEPSD